MKKNLITLIILVLCFANLALTAVMVITILPQTKQANELITEVVSAIDLDFPYLPAERNWFKVLRALSKAHDGETMTINLTPGSDGEAHMAVISVAVQMDSENADYETYASDGTLGDKEDMVKDKINEVVSSHTAEEVESDQAGIKDEITAALQEMYGSTFITGVSFSSIMVQ